MKCSVCTFGLALLIAHSMPGALQAIDWPQWRGPDRNAASKETGLLQEWPEAGPPLAWRMEGLGGGYGAPSISEGRIFGMSNRGADEIVWARLESDGKEIWATPLTSAITEGMPQGREGAGCTPTVDGNLLYVLGMGGDLACLQVSDGKIVWQRNLPNDFGGRVPTWRYNESPLVDGDQLICTPGGDDATIVALNKLNGELIWKAHVPAGPPRAQESADGRPSDGSGRPGRGPSTMESIPALAALDIDGDREISSDEIEDSPTGLLKLDKDGDGKLTEEELRPEFGGQGERQGEQRDRSPRQGGGSPGGGRGGMMRFFPVYAALDTDESAEIDADEIAKAVAALQTLDENKDGKLTEDEVRPRFGGGRGGRGGRGGFSDSGAAYASAIAIDSEGERQYVQLTSKALVGISAADGQLLWRYDRAANRAGINCSTPIFHDDLIFAASAYGNGGGAVRLTKNASGEITAEEVYFATSMQNHHGGMIVVDGCLYGAAGGNEGGFLVCLDYENGDVLWRDRKAPKGSLAFADGRLYLRSEEGEVILIEPNRDGFVEQGRFQQPKRTESPAWTHPVIANGKLYIRDQDVLFCYDVKPK